MADISDPGVAMRVEGIVDSLKQIVQEILDKQESFADMKGGFVETTARILKISGRLLTLEVQERPDMREVAPLRYELVNEALRLAAEAAIMSHLLAEQRQREVGD